MKYIDADKLISEIEKRKDIHRKNYEEFKDERFISDECEDDNILSLITSLQQEQPVEGLEREIIRYKVPFSDEREYLNEGTLDAIARHFYELGLNSKK